MSSASDATKLIPRPNYRHLARMTDDTAVFEHAWFCVPRWEHGYCVDDNARALIICSLADRTGEAAEELDRVGVTAMSFLRAASLDGCPVRTRIDHQRNWVDEGPVVSESAAGQMAVGAARVLGADVGLGLTGVAGPTEQDGQPVGTLCIGLSFDGEVSTTTVRLPGQREQMRQFCVINSLDFLRRRLLS